MLKLFRFSMQRLSFRKKILLGIAGIILVFAFTTGLLVSRIASNSLLAENKKRGASIASNMAKRAVEPLLVQDLLRLQTLVQQVTTGVGVMDYAFVADANGMVLTHSFKGGFPVELRAVNKPRENDEVSTVLIDAGDKRYYDFSSPVILDNVVLGTVRLGMDRDRILATIRDILATIVMITAGAMFAALGVGTLFAGTVTRRLNVLRVSAEEMIKGNLDLQTGPMLKINCWEIMSCDSYHCPAYGDERRRCWHISGTLCPECMGQGFPEKMDSCMDCPVFMFNQGDEIQQLSEAFDVMALSVKEHMEAITAAQKDLARQKNLLQTIFDVTPDMVTLQDANFVYKSVNKAFCRYFNFREDEVVGKTDFDIFPKHMAETIRAEDEEILDTGMPLTKELFVSRDPRHKRWFHLHKSPVFDGRRVIGLLLTARDISVVKRYQEQLIQSQKMEDLGKLAGGVAHEINTPLGVILGYTQMLLEDVPDASPVHQDLAIIEKQTKVCKHIVADLLKFSRNFESTMQEMDLNNSILEVVSLVAHIFRQERVTLETCLAEELPNIIGDAQKLKQVWLNLLNNAFDAVGSDGLIVISTRLCKHRQRVIVTVADSGAGIKEEDMNRIFDPFFSTKPVGKGTGLGLSVTFGIIQDHKGKISALSPAPLEYFGETRVIEQESIMGTVFFVELPIRGQPLTDECSEKYMHDAKETAESDSQPNRPRSG